MNTLLRTALILIVSLIAGILFNQFHPAGISWRWLLPASDQSHTNETVMIRFISADSAIKFLNDPEIQFIDIRIADDFQLDHIGGAIHLTFQQIMINQLPPWELKQFLSLVIYDQDGDQQRLKMAAAILTPYTSQDIYLLFGGYLAWLQKGYPIHTGIYFE